MGVWRLWLGDGWERVRGALLPVLQATAAAGIAYQVSASALGHERPFFAAIAAWMCLGWTFDRDLRRVAEIAVGVTLGVAIGDVVVRLIGSGWWQLSTVLLVAALLARFVDSGPLLVTQAGAQAIVIAGMPTLTGGPYGRALDAAVGSVVALAFVLLTPYFPVRSARHRTASIAGALATTARVLAAGIRDGDGDEVYRALTTGRGSETTIREAASEVAAAHSRVRWSINRGQRAELAALQRQDLMLGRAMHSLRVTARNLRFDIPAVPLAEREPLAALLDSYAVAADRLAADIKAGGGSSSGANGTASGAMLHQVARQLSGTAVTDPSALTTVVVLRPVIVDTLQAAGATFDEARAALGTPVVFRRE